MEQLELKLIAISRILISRDFSSLNDLPDLTDADVILLETHLNVRFSQSSSGFKCFLSSKIGKAGIAKNKVQALTFMLDNFQFKARKDQDIWTQVGEILASETV